MVTVEAPVLENNSPEVSETPGKQSFMEKIGSLFRKEPKPEIKPAEPLPYKIPSLKEREEMGGNPDLNNE